MNNSKNKRTILVLTDFSSCARNAADYALVLAGKFNANILLFHSYFVPVSAFDSWPTKDYPMLLERSMVRLGEEADRLKELLASAKSIFVPVIDCLSDGGTVADNVANLIAERPQILMVVMGGYRARNNDDFLFGTAISEVLGKAKCPAVIVPECDFLE